MEKSRYPVDEISEKTILGVILLKPKENLSVINELTEDDFYFNNEDSGYHVKLNNELNDKKKAVIYGVNTDGSLLILDCYHIVLNYDD